PGVRIPLPPLLHSLGGARIAPGEGPLRARRLRARVAVGAAQAHRGVDMANEEWGPLAGLIGEWEAQGGLDTAYSHEKHEVLDTPYLERVTMKPFGPVVNGRQTLY